MRFVTYNIQYGLGRDMQCDLDRISAAVDGADVIALQEVERFWPRSGMVDQPQELSKRLPEYWWVYGPNVDLHAPATFPGSAADRRRQFGNMVLSKHPIRSSRNIPLPRSAVGQRSMQRGALEVIVDGDRSGVRLYSVHLCYLSTETRFRQLNAIFDVDARAVAEQGAWAGEHPGVSNGWLVGDEPAVPDAALILGDLNFGPGSQEYEELITGPRGGGRFQDAWTLAGNGEMSAATHRAGRIDHCLVSSSLRARVDEVWIDHLAEGSDHQPVWARIDV